MASEYLPIKLDLLKRLKVFAGFSDGHLETFVYRVVADDFISCFHPHTGPDVPATEYYRPDGRLHTYDDVSLGKILEAAEFFIGAGISVDRRTEVFHQVMDGIPGAKQTPHWEEFPVNPHEKPETPFSVSRALPGVIKSNAELVDIMASAAGLNSRQATSVRVQITWWDAMGDEQNRPVLNGCTGTVTGGRLGRDHTLEDVPNHYVRDRVMDYINTQLDEEKRESTRKAVFSDLSAAEILEYASLIEKQREECEEEKKKKQQIVGNILGCRHVRSEEEAAHVWDQADVMDDIDVNIDLMPQPDFTSLTCDQKMSGSVMKPGFEPSPSETNVDVGTEIDRNCDQIRAMIKLLTLHGSWTVDQFRLALGHISRSQLTNFLRKRGPMEGIHTLSFQLGWEFFKKREVLGIPNSGALQNALEHQGALQERDPNRGQKRPTTGTGKDDEPVKHTRTTRSGDKSTKANA